MYGYRLVDEGVTILKNNLLTKGPIFKALVIFSLPIIATNTINILFHAADVAVLAFFSGDADVAAVGACGSLITLMVFPNASEQMTIRELKKP